MNKCGANCNSCPMSGKCSGCGSPFGSECFLHRGNVCEIKEKLLSEINAAGVCGLPEIHDLNALPGFFVNLEYTVSGNKIKLLDDSRIYLGNQIETGNGRCIGIAADEDIIVVCEYGENGEDPKLLRFLSRK